jgi:hypothetical protein
VCKGLPFRPAAPGREIAREAATQKAGQIASILSDHQKLTTEDQRLLQEKSKKFSGKSFNYFHY